MIDIVGLQISIPELLWTVVSFFLFMFLLKRFLFDPILSVMDARKARIKEGMDEGKNAQKALSDSKAQLALELSEKSADAKALLSDARSEAEKAKSAALGAAHAEAEKLHKEIKETVRAEEAAAESSIEGELPELVALLTGKLLGCGELSAEDARIRDSVNASKT